MIFGFSAIAYLLIKKQGDNKNFVNFLQTLQSGTQNDQRIIHDRLDRTSKVLMELQGSLGEIGEIGRSMKDMQSFLVNPKIRGNIGEQILKELLGQFLPKESFRIQYSFSSGEIVDAAILSTSGIIPIDSKFPLENFRKMVNSSSEVDKKIFNKQFEMDVKKHIDAISKKYIRPDEGTIDYALMYLPSENVYYEVINNSDIFDYAGEAHVLPVSPTTFYAFMKAILMSLEGQKVEERAKVILETIKAIQKDYSKVEASFLILQKHLTNASNTMGTVWNDYTKMGQKISSTRLLESKKSNI